MKILFASSNAGKAKEVQTMLNDIGVEIVTLADLALDKDTVEETGITFKENAQLKSKFFSEKSKLPTIADDSGLMVDCLDGEPGVYSNRWFPGSDEDRNITLLERLADSTNRKAKFVTVICYTEPAKKISYCFEGVVEGTIASKLSGSKGFGYDPIFIPKGYNESFAELGPEVKNKISHRAMALKKLKQFLKEGV